MNEEEAGSLPESFKFVAKTERMEFPEKRDLVDRYRHYSNEELEAILENSSDYQDVAVEAAREVALERGIDVSTIHPVKHAQTNRFFPGVKSPDRIEKLIKSIQRLFYFVAIIPLITATLSFTDGYPSLALVYGGIGVVWAVLSFLAVRRRRHQMVILMFLLIGFVLVLRYMTAGIPDGMRWVDWLVGGAGIFTLVYLMLFFQFLIRNLRRQERA